MTMHIRNLGAALTLSALLLWGCSGSGPQTDLVQPKSSEPAAPAAAPAPTPPPAPAPEPAAKAKPAPPAVQARQTRPDTAPSMASATAPTPPPASQPVPPPPPAPTPAPEANPMPAAPPAPTSKQVTITAGTQVYVRMIDSIDSASSHAGDSFRASLDRAIVVDNQTVVPRNVDVTLKLIDVQQAGKLSGTSQLKVQMDKIYINKKPYDVTSNPYVQSGDSEGKKAARNVGVGAAVGGILGGILGGGKGAVIGAGAGGGGGAVVSKGQAIRIDSETQLVFSLENPLDVTIPLPPTTNSQGSAPAGGPGRLSPSSNAPSSEQRSSADASDVSGTWTVATDQQNSTMRLVLRQNGNNLQGSITNPNGSGGTLSIQGSVSGNFITFSTTGMQFSGAINGDIMEGNVTISTASANNGSFGGYPGGGGRGGRGGGVGSPRAGNSSQAKWNAQRIE